jgi:hypothetical protein
MPRTMSSFHVAIAAEAAVAVLFARCGCDVSVQYGADQPEYDLIVARGDSLLKVSIKGSQDGSWGLTQSFLHAADYHGAVEKWLQRHGSKTIFCLVQFKDVSFESMPRAYLARPAEIAARLKATARGRGDTILYERKVWTAKAYGAGSIDEIPPSWRFSPIRLNEMFAG